MTNPYRIREASTADFPHIVDTLIDAFWDDECVGNIGKAVDIELRRKADFRWQRFQFDHARLTGSRYWVVVEEKSGQIVAFAKWEFPITLTEAQKEEKRNLERELDAEPSPPGTNIGLRDDFFGQLDRKRDEWRNPEVDYYMHILAVRRSHHRRGLGGRLLAVGLAMADEAGRKTFIEASRAGIELYKRYGWELVGEVKVDLESHGFPGLGVYTEGCLMRQPKGKGKEESGREARAIANAVGEKVMG